MHHYFINYWERCFLYHRVCVFFVVFVTHGARTHKQQAAALPIFQQVSLCFKGSLLLGSGGEYSIVEATSYFIIIIIIFERLQRAIYSHPLYNFPKKWIIESNRGTFALVGGCTFYTIPRARAIIAKPKVLGLREQREGPSLAIITFLHLLLYSFLSLK